FHRYGAGAPARLAERPYTRLSQRALFAPLQPRRHTEACSGAAPAVQRSRDRSFKARRDDVRVRRFRSRAEPGPCHHRPARFRALRWLLERMGPGRRRHAGGNGLSISLMELVELYGAPGAVVV